MSAKQASLPTHVPLTSFLHSLILRTLDTGPATLPELRSSVFKPDFIGHVFDRAWYHTIDVMESAGWLEKTKQGREASVQLTADGRLELENYRAFCRLFTE